MALLRPWTSLLRLFHMARHLEFSQITSRLWRLLKRIALAVRPQHYHRRYHRPVSVTVSPNLRAFVQVSQAFSSLRYSPQWLTEAAGGRFTFLNQTRELNLEQPDFWSPAATPDLWQLNLHCFDYAPSFAYRARELLTEDSEQARRLTESVAGLVLDWIEINELGRNRWAWDSYAISSRSLNWMITYAVFAEGPPQVRSWLPAGFCPALARSLAAQLRYLADNLEYDVLGNHLLRNAVALLYGAQFFEGQMARQWRQQGEKVLRVQVAEQILADGAHYELSPMYHCLVLQDILTLAILLGSEQTEQGRPPLLRTVVCRMLGFLEAVSHPDGELPLFNDSVFGIAPPIAELRQVAEQVVDDLEPAVPSPEQMLAASGYWPARSGEDLLIADCGPLADPRCAGHSHCDMLSFELSVDGQRFVVDSGVYQYAPGMMRDYSRSTAAHNTLMVDGHEQTEMWGSFRTGRRARIIFADVSDDGHQQRLTGLIESYDQYFRHERTFVVQADSWLIWDQTDSPAGQQAQSFLHLHPEVELTAVDETTFRLHRGDTQLWLYCMSADRVEVGEGWYCPEFYRRQKIPVLCLQRSVQPPGTAFGYLICQSEVADMQVTQAADHYVISWAKHQAEIAKMRR